jgi:dTDP-4-amino-4,6-dideoxygalactose transaminase
MARICRRHSLRLIEDCAQAFGADVGGRKCGTHGDLGCFSFFPSKNLGCFGDGGMVVTDDAGLAEQVRLLRNHGSPGRFDHRVLGYNSRLDELQAAVLRVKLRHLDRFNEGRRRVAGLYTARLAGSPVTPPFEDGKGRHVYHQYTVLTGQRQQVQEALAGAGIASAVYYPIPLHRQVVYQQACARVVLPRAEEAVGRVLSLPVFPELREEEVAGICDVVLAAVSPPAGS